MEKITPTPEQESAITQMVWETSGAVLNASTMGAGKTVKAVEVVRRRDDKVVLLIAPLGTSSVGRPHSSARELRCLFGGSTPPRKVRLTSRRGSTPRRVSTLWVLNTSCEWDGLRISELISGHTNQT
jgi:hypothetical protein